MELKFNVIGKISSGTQHDGWYVLIERYILTERDEIDNTGGYLVFYSEEEDFSVKLYDDWFETIDEVEQNFRHRKMSIEWTNKVKVIVNA